MLSKEIKQTGKAMIGGPVSLKFTSLNFDDLYAQSAVRWIFEVTRAKPTVRARTCFILAWLTDSCIHRLFTTALLIDMRIEKAGATQKDY